MVCQLRPLVYILYCILYKEMSDLLYIFKNILYFTSIRYTPQQRLIFGTVMIILFVIQYNSYKNTRVWKFYDLGHFVTWVVSWLGSFGDGTFSDGSFRDLGPFVTGSFCDGALCDGSFCDGSFRDAHAEHPNEPFLNSFFSWKLWDLGFFLNFV
jgi:hypothetical protein